MPCGKLKTAAWRNYTTFRAPIPQLFLAIRLVAVVRCIGAVAGGARGVSGGSRRFAGERVGWAASFSAMVLLAK